MKLEVFKEIVEKLKKQSQKERDAYQAGIELFNFNEEFHSLISILIGCYYGKESLDTFEWWCYEKDWGSRTDLTMTDQDGNHLCQTLEDLHEYLEKNKKDDYELPKKMTLHDLENELNNLVKAFNK
jgi:DNA-binding GntR family transcriptional regulator